MSVRRITTKTWFEGPTPPDQVLPEGRVITVQFALVLPAAAGRREIMEWVLFELGAGSIAISNPLHDQGLEAEREPYLTDTGYTTDAVQRRREVFG